MQNKIIAVIFFTSSIMLAMQENSTTYTSVFSAANPARKEEDKAIATEYRGINSINPKTQASKNPLLERYVDSMPPQSFNETIPGQLVGPLHIAARSDFDNDILIKCLNIMHRHQIPLNGCDATGNTPLMVACDYRAVKNTRILAEINVETKNLDDADKEYRTALHHVCSPTLDSFNPDEIASRFTCAEILLKNGANPNVLDGQNLTPLCYVATTFFGSFTNTPASTPLSAAQFDRFADQRKGLISLLIRHKAKTNLPLSLIKKLKETISDDYLGVFEHHIQLPTQNHECNLH